jgi:nicotinamide phosphoribosyltransferase
MPQEVFYVNPLEDMDEYKIAGHLAMIPAGTTKSVLYLITRGGELPYAQLFNFQGLIKQYFLGKFFTQEDLDEITARRKAEGRPFYPEMWQYILDKYDGHLPLRFSAVKEGKKIGLNNVLATIESTDENCAGLPGQFETMLMRVWHGSTVCVKSSYINQITSEYLDLTSDAPEAMKPYMLNDFGSRSTPNRDAAAVGGAAHLLNGRGSDTGLGERYLKQFYNALKHQTLYDSVTATEHSVMTPYGPGGEVRRVGEILDKFPTGLLSIVGDSYDIYNFTENIIGGVYRDRIAARIGKVVVRPDSDDPLVVVPRLLDILAERFGHSVNRKGYKVLSPCVGIIFGDGMDLFSIRRLYAHLKDLGWAAENVVVGMGGGLLQKVNRDTQLFAIKLCAQTRDGIEYDIYKEAPGKKSHRGHPALVYREEFGKYETIRKADLVFPLVNEIERVAENGILYRDMTFDEIASYSRTPYNLAA